MEKNHRQIAIDAIKKKLIGNTLSYPEIYAIMDEIAHQRLGPILTTYFTAAGFKEGFSHEELYSLTKAMVDTGTKLHFSGIVADKHSTGGVAGTRTTMILVPIIAAAGFTIPKNSTRAITSPAGTADTMEVVAPVTFTPKQIQKIVGNVGGCIVWGGHLGLAPADDVLIQVGQPLGFESYDKIVVSVFAKKVASGATHVVMDIPVGPTLKIQHFKDADLIAQKYQFLAKKFHMKVIVDINEMHENAGRGVGPILEVKDVFSVLEQQKDRSLTLENKALRLAGKLLSLCLNDAKKKDVDGEALAREILTSGKAHKKMLEIIKAQGGDWQVENSMLKPGKYMYEVKSQKKGHILSIDNRQITTICRILGCPTDKASGLYQNRKLEEAVDKGDILCTLYSSDRWRLKEAVETMKNVPVYEVRTS